MSGLRVSWTCARFSRTGWCVSRPNIDFRLGDQRFNYCVRAVIRRHGAVLVCVLPGCDWCFLPGGRVRAGETSQAALERELQEELGVRTRVGALAMVVENFFPDDVGRFHELGLYYEVSLSLDVDPTASRDMENGASFRWVPMDDLAHADLRPRLLHAALAADGRTAQHLVNIE